MTTIKDTKMTVKLFEKHYKKGIHDVDTSLFKLEVDLRTKLARAIAHDNPPLDPNKPEDLPKTANLPEDTILSCLAETIYKKYIKFLETAFNLVCESKEISKESIEIKTFSDIKLTYIKLHGHKSTSNEKLPSKTWRPYQLSAYHKLCVRLARDNNLNTEKVMRDFENLDNLAINEASILLAERLFETLKS